MAGEIAQAFVRIRPNVSGFQAETESGVKSALVSVGKITAGFFAIKGLTDEFKQIADAAAQHEASFAVLSQSIRNAGASAKVFGDDIEALIQRESKLKGFSEEDLAASFTKLVGVTKDSGKAFKDLALVEDISRARHIEVSTASLALSRALQGSTTSLSRLGIIVPKVTTEQAKLRAEHDRLSASGVKFTGSVKDAYTAQLAAAKAADAQANRFEALRIVQDKFGGSAKAFANSAAGQFERFGVSVHLLEVSLGKLLLPTLTAAAESLTRWVDELTNSETVHRDVAAGVSLVKTAFNDLRATVQFLEPVLRPVVGLLQDIVGFSGAGGILVAVGAFKAVGAATEVAAAAQRKYLELVALGRGNVQEETTARQAAASAIGQDSAALERHAVLLGEDAAASTRAAAGTAEFTGSLRANEAALAAGTVTNAARGAGIAGTTQAASAGPDAAAAANVTAAAATGAESLKELSQAASDAGASLGNTVDTIGTLASDVDHSANVLEKAGRQTTKASAAARGLANDTTTATAAAKSFDATQTSSIAGIERKTAALSVQSVAIAKTAEASTVASTAGVAAAQRRMKEFEAVAASNAAGAKAAVFTTTVGEAQRVRAYEASAKASFEAANAAKIAAPRQVAAYEATGRAALAQAAAAKAASEQAAIANSGLTYSRAERAQAALAASATKAAAAQAEEEAAVARTNAALSTQTKVLASTVRTSSLAAETAAVKTGAAQQGLAAVTVKTSLQESEALLATARAAEIGSRGQVAAYEASAAAALKAEAVTIGAAERSAGAVGIGGASQEMAARNRVTGLLSVARANPAGSELQIKSYETAIARAQQLAGAEKAVGDATVVSAAAAGRSAAANEALAAARAAVAAGALDEAGQERIAAAAKLEGAAAARAEATALAELAAARAALKGEQFFTGGVGVPGGLGAGAASQAARAAEAEAVLAALSRENATAKLAETGATNELTAASAKTVPALAEETAATNASAVASERAIVANEALAASQLAVGAAASTAAIEETAASATKLARAEASAGAALKGLGRSALAFVGGTPTIVAAALAATAFGIYKLVTAESAADRANDKLRDGLLALGADLRGVSEATKAANEALSSLKTDRISAAEARLSLERAKSALATSDAGRATLEYRQLTEDLAGAENQLRLAEKQVADTEKTLADARSRHARSAHDAEVQRHRDVTKTLNLEKSIVNPPPPKNRGGQAGRVLAGLEVGVSAIKGLLDTRSEVSRFADKVEKDQEEAAKKGFPRIARQLGDLHALSRALDRLPTKKEIEIFFKNPQTGGTALFEKLALEQLRATRTASGFVASLEVERRAVEKNDPGLARRAGLIENLARATGRKIPPQIVQFIFRSNVQAGIRRMISELDRANVSLGAFRTTLERESGAFAESNPALSRRIILLSQFAGLVGRFPTRHETAITFKAPTALGAVVALQGELAKMDGAARAHGAKSGEDWAKQFFLGLTKIPFLNDAFKLADVSKATKAATEDALGKAAVEQMKGQLTTAKQVVDTARQGVESARQSLADARRSVLDAQQALADAIEQGNQQINDSLRSAGSNLISIGQSLSDDIAKFFDAQSAKGQQAPSGPLAARLKELEALIHAGKATPALIRKAQEVEAELNAQQSRGGADNDKKKARVQRRLADLTDEFNTGKISLARFNREVAALLKKEGINYRNAGRVLGIAFADGFRAQLLGLREQAAAIARFGRRPGLGAFGVSVEKPTEVRSKVQEQIARDQEAVVRAQSAVLKDIKVVAAKERTLAVANTKADKIREAIRASNKHLEAIASTTAKQLALDREIQKQAKERASNSGARPFVGSRGIVGAVGRGTEQALLDPLIERGLDAKSGGAKARRTGRELVREFTALGGELGDGLRLGLQRGERRFFLALERLIHGGHAGARKAARAHSPSELFADLGEELVGGIVVGLARSRPLLTRASDDLIGTVLRRISDTRGLTEQETMRQVIARAQKVGKLAAGRASVTVLVGADTKPATAAMDALRRTAEQRKISVGTASAARQLRGAAEPRIASRPAAINPVITTVGRHAIGPVGAIGDRQRLLLLNEERKHTRLLEQIVVEERKHTILLRRDPPRARRRAQKELHEATQEATATAVHNLLGS